MDTVQRISTDADRIWIRSRELDSSSAQQLVQACEHPRQTLKDGGDTFVARFDAQGQAWVVKRYALPAWKVAVYHAVRRTPAWREWQAAQRLAGAHVRVCQPLVLIHGRRGRWAQAVIARYVQGMPLNHFLREQRPDHATRLRLAELIGRQIGQMTAAGLVNRDHKAANLIVDAACAAGQEPPVLVDPAGLRRRGRRQVLRMFVRLLQTVSQATPVTPRERLMCLRGAIRADPSLAGSRRLVADLRLAWASMGLAI